MILYDNLTVNPNGNLAIGGVDTVKLAEKYGTPLYVMDEDKIRENCRSYTSSIAKYYGGNGCAAFACKALCNKAVCNIAKEENMGLDCVSGGELYTAKSVDFPAERIYFHGNNKSAVELKEAIEYGVGRIVVDNFAELEMLDKIALSLKKTVGIMLRIKPGIDAHTHDFIRTGQIDSKFGFALETGEALEAAKYAATHKNLALKGVHCHIGSQIFDINPFELAADVMLGFLKQVNNTLGINANEINLGGGFGVKYTESENPAEYDAYMQTVSQTLKAKAEEYDMEMPFVVLEPGRSIVASAGITLYTVGSVKNIPNIRKYVAVDGGMTDNPRYALYKARYTALIANKANQAYDETVTIAGRLCETGDLLGENMPLQKAEVGDILAMLTTGAYNYVMASNYNRVPRPAMVMVKNGEDRIVVKRESYSQIVENDLL